MYDPDLIACMKLSASWMAITEQGLTMIDSPIWERDFKPFSLNAANKTAQFIRYFKDCNLYFTMVRYYFYHSK